MTDPSTQHDLFKLGVQLLGGSRNAARLLDASERTLSRLLAGEAPLHDGWLRDISRALLQHSDACRALEKRLNPMFAANVHEGQPQEDNRRAGGRKRAGGRA